MQRLLHRVIWSDHHGPIPRDCIIHHIDGNPLNNEISNLSCIPLIEHLSVYHTERKYKYLKEIECLRCKSIFKPKTKRSRFCPDCVSIFLRDSKENTKWHPKKAVPSIDKPVDLIASPKLEKERTKYKNHIYTRDPQSKNKAKRLYFRRKYYDPISGKIRQELLHRVIWSDHYGEIPCGAFIIHKDGNSSNNEISNLERVDRQEFLRNCRKNSAMKKD